jgi:hypothetical protein
MMLRRRIYKKSKVRTYSIAVISLLILACEIWYVDALNAREPKSSRTAASQKYTAYNHHPFLYALMEQERSGRTKHLITSTLLTGKEKGTGDPRLFFGNDGMLSLTHILESVCVGSNPCRSITVAQLHAKEAK